MTRLWHRGGKRVDSPRERNLAARLDQASPSGASEPRRLSIHSSPFAIDVAAYLRAAAGPPAWSRRLVRIQQLEADLRLELQSAWEDHRARFADRPYLLRDSWNEHLNQVDLSAVNELIDKHNLYYPIEAGLRMQWPSGRYILPSGVQFPLPRLTVDRLLAEFSPRQE